MKRPPSFVRATLACTLAALTLSLPCASSAEAPLDRPRAALPEVHIEFEKYELPNGLEVILSRDARLPRVSVNLWYHVGPVNEPHGRSGFAHLFEHLMFEGSKHVGRSFDFLMESMGASNVNGTTSWDRTNYYETVPSEHLATALWIESDRMAFMVDTLSSERLEAQRDIVKNERRQSYENAPYGKSALELLNVLFPPGHPYHGAVIGSMEDLSRATMQDVRAFYETYYAPNNATLALVGDFEPAEAKRLIEHYFGTLRSRPIPASHHAPTPRLQKPVRKVVDEPVALAQVSMGWLTPPAFSEADAALELALEILTGGRASRLYRELVVEKQLASEVSSYLDSNRLASIVTLDARATKNSDPAALETALGELVLELGKEGPSKEELARVKRRLNVGFFKTLELLNGSDGESGRAGLLQRFNHYKGDPGYARAWLEALNGVSQMDVRKVVQEHLSEKHRVTVLTRPKPSHAPAE